MEELHKESGEIFVNYMTRLIMEEVSSQDKSARNSEQDKSAKKVKFKDEDLSG